MEFYSDQLLLVSFSDGKDDHFYMNRRSMKNEKLVCGDSVYMRVVENILKN